MHRSFSAMSTFVTGATAAALLVGALALNVAGPAHGQSRNATGAEWPMPGKDYAGTRFSEPGQITSANVANLKLAFTFSTGMVRGHEAAPIVVGDTMYIVTPYPNVLYALDLAKPGAPAKWKFEPK